MDQIDGVVQFVDVSEEAGIYGSEIGFGLGVTVGDVNRDGWLDIFVSNDFFERDYLYINQQDGTFKEAIEEQIHSLSVASMGADMADLNNDAYPEIFVTEMLPEDEARYKTKMTFENWDRYQYNLQNGYYHQFTRNVLQLNNRNGTFSEIGRMAGVEATDWSWGALIADYDNDGYKDLYVCNGLYKDIIDQDYINFVSNEEIIRQMVTKEGVNYKELIDTIPSTKIANYLFRNDGNLQFDNWASKWGIDQLSHSNGSAYGDLDNDGDLDLVVNNVNDFAFIYENQLDQRESKNNYLQVQLIGYDLNPFAVGASVTLYCQTDVFFLESLPVRGFQSSVDPRLLFGLGGHEAIDSLVVQWPDGTMQVEIGIQPNQKVDIYYQNSSTKLTKEVHLDPYFKEITEDVLLDFEHRENRFVDFDRDRLVFHMISTEGPRLAIGDVNGDSYTDFYIGGAIGQHGKLYIQSSAGTFQATNENVFRQLTGSEDLGASFFDADQDGDQDLYVAHGGNEYLISTPHLIDQLFLNDGDGNLKRSPQYLPTFAMESTSCVAPSDFDLDGDVDLFVGVRIKPGYYGLNQNGYLLKNNGKGQFSNGTGDLATELLSLGMITDAVWADIDNDADEDLIVVGEWMSVAVFENDDGRFTRKNAITNPNAGWWNAIEAGDLDQDGDMDFVLGNHGLNSRFRASEDKPIELYVNDFDNNNTPDPILCQYNGAESYPLCLRHDLVMQLPHLKKKYTYYKDYKEQTIRDIFSEEQIKNSIVQTVNELRSVILRNDGQGKFEIVPLPWQAQLSPVYAISIHDFTKDGHVDILVGGNLYNAKPEVGRYDASFGVLLAGDGNFEFDAIHPSKSGFFVRGEIRDLERLRIGQRECVLVARNNGPMQIFNFNEKNEEL